MLFWLRIEDIFSNIFGFFSKYWSVNHLLRACFDNEIVIAIGGASGGRAHARTGDRYQDMKEMGIEPK